MERQKRASIKNSLSFGADCFWPLWQAEQKIFGRVFRPEQSLLEVDCGSGRIAFGFWDYGYHKVLGTDGSRERIREARRLNRLKAYGLCFHVSRTTQLKFEDALFDGAIWGIEAQVGELERETQRRALSEVYRVLVPGAWFVWEALEPDSGSSEQMEQRRQDLQAVGFRIEVAVPSTLIAQESPQVAAVAERCHFWVSQKQGATGTGL